MLTCISSLCLLCVSSLSLPHTTSARHARPQPISARTGHFVEQFTEDWADRWSPSAATKTDRNQEVFSYGALGCLACLPSVGTLADCLLPYCITRVSPPWNPDEPHYISLFNPHWVHQSENGRSRSQMSFRESSRSHIAKTGRRHQDALLRSRNRSRTYTDCHPLSLNADTLLHTVPSKTTKAS